MWRQNCGDLLSLLLSAGRSEEVRVEGGGGRSLEGEAKLNIDPQAATSMWCDRTQVASTTTGYQFP